MSLKLLIAATLAVGLGSGAGLAQTAGQSVTRDPVHGTHAKRVARHRTGAAATAAADKQPPGTENGNQPDRAMAVGGGR